MAPAQRQLPGVATDLAVLHEAPFHVGFDDDWYDLPTEGAGNEELL